MSSKRAEEIQYLNMIANKAKHKLEPPGIDINTYPGKRLGLTPEQVQDFIKRQKRCLGKSFELVTGANDNLEINLPGTAYMLLGWAIEETALGAGNTANGDLKVRLNNEVMVEGVHWEFFGKDFTDEEYYFIPRPLSGQDSFSFAINGVTDTWTAKIIFYYL